MFPNYLLISSLSFFQNESLLPNRFLMFSNRAREALRSCLPDAFKDGTFLPYLTDDQPTARWLAQLLETVQRDM